MTNYAKFYRERENARLDRLEEAKRENCQHRYQVPLLVHVVPVGTPCALCGKKYEGDK